MVVRCVVQAADQLGEGPVWSAAENKLYWFDIKGRRLSWCEPASEGRGVFELPVRASAAAVRRAGGLLVATERGLAVCDPTRGTFEIVQPHDLGEGFRTNDGKVDTCGRFWWSTMDDNGGERPGKVFITEPSMATREALSGVHIPNTVSFSPDGSTLYLADSKRQTMFAHQVDDLSKVREFADTRGQAATPDGSAVDADGYLWNAQWGGWRIVRYAPDGRIDRIVEVPVQQPTSCAFGGPDLATLYVTSAREGLDAAALAKQPLAGGLFACEPGVKGLPLPLFEG